MAGRLDDLFRERSELLHRKRMGYATARELLRVPEIEEEIDRLEAIEMGPDLDRLEKIVERMEDAARKVQAAADSVQEERHQDEYREQCEDECRHGCEEER